MRRHEYESPYNPAATELSRTLRYDRDIRPDTLDKITLVLEGVKRTDEMISQKDQLLVQKDNVINQKTIEVQSKNNLLAQKDQLLIQKDKNLEKLKETGTVGEQKEFVDALHKLYPNWYPERLEDWSSDTWGKQVIDRGDFRTIQANLPAYRQQVAEKEFIDILHELYPSWYPINLKDWPADSWGKEVIDRKDYKAIEGNLPIYKQWLANKKELIEILPKLHPQFYPVNYEEWTNQYAKGLLDKGDYKTIEQSLPLYRKQLARKEFIEILPKLYPNDYPVRFKNWTNQWGKGVIDREDYKTITGSLPIYKKQLLKKEFIDIMHQVNPKDYPANFEDWSNKTLGNEILEKEDYKAMEQSLSDYRQKLKEIEKEKLLSQKENELKKLTDNEQEIVKLKELLILKEVETQNKDQLLLAKELEKKELLAQKDQLLGNKDNVLSVKDKEIENLNQLILAEKTKIEELLVEKANEQQKLIDKDNLLSDQTENIERINILLETKEIIIQTLEQEKEILQIRHDMLDMKMQLTVKEFKVTEREKEFALKKLAEGSKLLADYKGEMLKFKELCAIKDAEIKDKDELLSQKELEKQELLAQKEIEKVVLLEDLQEKLHSKDSEILGLKMIVNEIDLAGDYHIEDLN